MTSFEARQASRLNRDEAHATTVMRTLGFAQLMAAGAEAETFPAVHQGGAGAVVRKAVTSLWSGTIPEAVADVLAACADMIVSRGDSVGILDGWDDCPVAVEMLNVTAAWAADGRPAAASGLLTPPHALASSLAFDRAEDAAVLHGTWVLLALAHQRDPDDEYADEYEDDGYGACDECGGELRGKGTYGCSCWNPTACDECGDEAGDCDCWI
jgi:hypothetical protein